MSVVLGSGEHRYRVVENWAKLPDGWEFRDVAAVAVDSKDRVYVFNRGQHPMMVFDRDGNFLRSWGEGLFNRAHGIHIDSDDTLYCTDDGDHTVRKITTDGKVLLTIGVPNQPAPFLSGKPFNRCTHTALSPKGEIYVSDGYGNSRVHKYSPDGKHLMCWGTTGTDPGEFNIAHNIVTDEDGWVYVADRENHRVQVFDGNGKYETQWNNMHRPCALYCCCGGKNPQFIIGELGPGMPVNTQAHQPRAAPGHRRQEGQDLIARLGGEARPRPGARQVPVAARPRRRLQGRHLCRRGELHQLAQHPSRRAGAQVPAFPAEAREGALMGAPEASDRLHLIGSIPLDNSEQVFRRLADELGPILSRMPDGETGERSRWVYFQRQMLLDHPAMEIDPTVPPYKFVQWDGKVVREIEQAPLQARHRSGDGGVRNRLRQGRSRLLGNLQAAARLRRDPRHVRFQVCLPTPHASGYLYVSGPARQTYFSVYERALKVALANIVKAIPAADLVDPVGRLPGGAGLRELFQGPAGGLQKTDLRHAGAAGRCRAGRRGNGLSPLLRLAARRASGSAQGFRHSGRDDERHRRRHPAGASISSTFPCPRTAPTTPTMRRSRVVSGRRRERSSISACCTMTTPRAIARASRRRGVIRRRIRPVGRVRLGPHRARAAARAVESSS